MRSYEFNRKDSVFMSGKITKIKAVEKNDPYLSIRLGSAHSFFIPSDNGAVLIDVGNAHKVSQLKSVLHAHEYALDDIRHVIVTHTHHDHVGSLAELKKRAGANIIVHETEANYLRLGRTPLPKGTTAYAKVLVALGRLARVGAFTPIEADIFVTNSFDLSDIGINGYLLHTPGHTQGSMSVILNDGIAFVGDTLFNIHPETVYPPFANDPNRLLHSWRLLYETGCKIFNPSHGKPIEREKFRRCFLKRNRSNLQRT